MLVCTVDEMYEGAGDVIVYKIGSEKNPASKAYLDKVRNYLLKMEGDKNSNSKEEQGRGQ